MITLNSSFQNRSDIFFFLVYPTTHHLNRRKCVWSRYRSIIIVYDDKTCKCDIWNVDFFCDILIKINKYAEIYMWVSTLYLTIPHSWSAFYLLVHLSYALASHSQPYHPHRMYAFIKLHCFGSLISGKPLWKMYQRKVHYKLSYSHMVMMMMPLLLLLLLLICKRV